MYSTARRQMSTQGPNYYIQSRLKLYYSIFTTLTQRANPLKDEEVRCHLQRV